MMEKGYTRDEIANMMPIMANGKYILRDSNQLNRYFKNSKNWLMTELKPVMESMKHKSVYIKQNIKELDDRWREMESYKQGIDQRIESFEEDIQNHLWVTDDFVEPASKGLDKTRADVEKLLDRLAEVVKGFKALPREEDEEGWEEKPSRTRKSPSRQRRGDTAAVRTARTQPKT